MRRAPAILVALFALLAGAIILSQRIPARAAYDQKLYHVPSIQQFADALPAFDPWDYLSATTPGYHILYALFYRATSGSLIALQLVSALIAATFFWLLASMIARKPGHAVLATCALCLPLLTSPYTLYPSVFILPDMLGWLCVLIILAISLRERITPAWLALASAVLVMLVMTRQIHVWVAGPLVFATALQALDFAAKINWFLPRTLVRAVIRSLPAIIACIPAVVLLALFVRYWGGLVPPRFQGWYPTRTVMDMVLSPAGAFFLTMTGIYGCFFLPFILEPLRDLWRRHRTWLLLALALGALIALLPDTTYNYEAGRRTGVWNLTQRLPTIANHTSPIILLGTIWGALVLTALLWAQPLRHRLIYLCTIAAYCAAMSASQETWQRYFDPMVLMLLVLLSAQSSAAHPAQFAPRLQSAGRTIGPALLAALLLVQSALPFVKSDATTMNAPPPPAKSEVHQGAEPPVLFPPPEKPAGKRFWPF